MTAEGLSAVAVAISISISLRGLRLRQASRSIASNIVKRPAEGFASRAVVLSFVAGDIGKGASHVRVQAKIGRDRLTSFSENSARRDPAV